MKIDIARVPNLKKGDIPVDVLKELIDKHQKLVPIFKTLDDYYIGSTNTVEKDRILESSLNNIVVNDFAKFITDINVGYSMSNAVNYLPKNGVNIDLILDEYKNQTIKEADKLTKKDASKYGRGYQLTYANKEAKPITKRIDPKNGFIVQDNTLEENTLFGVYYYPVYDIANVESYNIMIVTDTWEITATAKDISLNGYTAKKKPHYFKMCPMIEFKNNFEELGDYETVLTLIDAYNIIDSNDVDNIEQFVDAILLLIGANLTKEQIDLLNETRGMNLPPEGKAEYLTKTLDEAGITQALERKRQDIHKFSMTPDISDKEFAGNSSGVALAYKLLPFLIATSDKMAFFEKGLRNRLGLYNNYLNIKSNMPLFNLSDVEIKFVGILPKNDLEMSQIITALKGMVSQTTLISQLSFVDDPTLEKEVADKEKLDNMQTFNSVGLIDSNQDNQDNQINQDDTAK